MTAAIGVMYIIGKGHNGFGETVVILQGHLDHGFAHLFLNVKYIFINYFFTVIEVPHIRFNAALKVKGVGLTSFIVTNRSLDSLSQIGLMPKVIGNPFV